MIIYDIFETNKTSPVYSTYSTEGSINGQQDPIIDSDLYLLVMSIGLGIICQTIAVFGTASNIINLVIFIKQGFSESINISLLALAISDLCSLVTIMWSNLCFIPAFRDSDTRMVTYEVHLITGSWPHVVFTRITGWITAFISFERCICVILPLKVKTIFTPKRHVVVMISFFVVTTGCASMAYASAGLGWRFYPDRNRSMIGLVYHMDAHRRYVTDSVSYAVNGVLMPVSNFLSVIVCTAILVVKLNQTSSWRNSHSSAINLVRQRSNLDANVSSKERKVATMVVLISVIFVVSFIPAVVTFVAGIVEPELTYDGVYQNLFLVTLSVSFTTEAINSSINMFVYLSMSTKYRETFRSMFGCKMCK